MRLSVCWYSGSDTNRWIRAMPLTDAQCRAAKVQKLSDGRGLFLQVTPGGSKLWRMNYRWQGKQRTASFFGSYSNISLAGARLKAAELKDGLAAGVDPALKEGAPATPEKSFREAAREWAPRPRSQMGQRLCLTHLGKP